ncbi:MAG: hypothetical protein K5656_09395 [Lachnospiraceae bacterium]|nr:hypothetical protein [Lachnospiraceae bacterium]
MKSIRLMMLVNLFFVTFLLLGQLYETDVAAESINATVEKSSIKVGELTKITTTDIDVSYKCSDTKVASVGVDGVVIGKKPGAVKITVSKNGYTSTVIPVTIKKNKYKPNLSVTADEVSLKNTKCTQTVNGKFEYSAYISNNSKSGTVRKVVFYFMINDNVQTNEEASSDSSASTVTGDSSSKAKKVTLTAKNIKPKKKSALVKCQADSSGLVENMKPYKIKIETKDAKFIYNIKQRKACFDWRVKDTTPPVIKGWVGKKSSYRGIPTRVVYTDRKSSFNFKKHVSAKDNRDGKVNVSVSTKKINWDKSGIYKVYYTATDSAGNTKKTWAKVQVIKPGSAEQKADAVLSAITSPGWSDDKKLRAIYSYVHSHCTYTGYGPHADYRNTGLKGIQNGRGDCFTFYSVSRLLITRSGIPNLEVRRSPAHAGHNHWWNLVYVNGGWYHFDATPRARPGYFCLQTDAQLRIYSTDYTFSFNKKLYPKRATKRISRNPV